MLQTCASNWKTLSTAGPIRHSLAMMARRCSQQSPAVKVQQLTANTTAIAVSGAAISPDGTYLAYADPTGLYLQVIETGETSPVVLSEDLRFSELAWLPDGTRLIGAGWATLGSTVALYSISILGGAPRKLRDGWRPGVSPDGKRIAFRDAAWPVQAIWTMGVDGQDPRQFVVGEEGEMFFQVCWSPDGRRLAYGHMSPDGTTAITSVDTDGLRRTTLVSDPDLFQHWRGILPCSWLPDGRLLFGKRDHPPNQFSSKLWAVSVRPPDRCGFSAPRDRWVGRIQYPGYSNHARRRASDGVGRAQPTECLRGAAQ